MYILSRSCKVRIETKINIHICLAYTENDDIFYILPKRHVFLADYNIERTAIILIRFDES